MKRRHLTYFLFAAATFLVTSCSPDGGRDQSSASEYPLETSADSLGMRIVEAWGGKSAWESLPFLQFDFAIEQNGTRNVIARHLWNRRTGDYRLERGGDDDTTFVVLFNIHTREGTAYANGQPLPEPRSSQLVEEGYRRFINDTYWMLAPSKVFDPGVNRTHVADSATAEFDVLHLTFDGVGLTPGDRYWLYAERESGLVRKWAFILQGNPDAPPSYHRWEDYEAFESPQGPIRIATRKSAMNGSRSTLTDNIRTPEQVVSEMFEDPQPRL